MRLFIAVLVSAHAGPMQKRHDKILGHLDVITFPDSLVTSKYYFNLFLSDLQTWPLI